MSSYILIAQDPPAPAADPAKPKAAPGPFGDPMFLMLMFGAMIVIMFILPARQQRKAQQQLLASIKRGAKVVTSGGIIGTIVNLKDNEDEITLRSEDAKIKVTKSSIARVLGQEEEAAKV